MKAALVSVALAAFAFGCGGSAPPAATSADAPKSGKLDARAKIAENGAIRAFSADEIRGYTEGRAMRFGRAAEKNHNPSPYFLIKYRSQLALFDVQLTPAKTIMDGERAQAAKLGAQLLVDEAKLEKLLAASGSREDEVASLVREMAHLTGEIRLVHLQANLAAKKLLSSDQQVQYEAIRSYDPDEDGRDALDRDGNCNLGP